jgi:hypothetical protein
MVAEILPMDYWSLFVNYVFGSFWMAVVGLCLLFFIILGPLGRVSIYTTVWYVIFFLAAMSLGYGYLPITVLVWVALLIALYLSVKGYIDKT